jgi:signal transduction histidine kinase
MQVADRLHDTVCQYAAALNTEVFMLCETQYNKLDPHMERIRDLAERICLELRQIINDLRRPNP